jgi:hypothetical protein
MGSCTPEALLGRFGWKVSAKATQVRLHGRKGRSVENFEAVFDTKKLI